MVRWICDGLHDQLHGFAAVFNCDAQEQFAFRLLNGSLMRF